jgi:hypothetical protein
VLQHKGGNDSISEKKLEKGDAQWKPSKVLLCIQTTGGGGTRMPSIHTARQTSYVPQQHHNGPSHPRGVISFADFRKIHGQVQYISSVIPCIWFLMTPLNQRLSQPDHPVGLGKGSKIRKVLKRMAHIMDLARPDLPT